MGKEKREEEMRSKELTLRLGFGRILEQILKKAHKIIRDPSDWSEFSKFAYEKLADVDPSRDSRTGRIQFGRMLLFKPLREGNINFKKLPTHL